MESVTAVETLNKNLVIILSGHEYKCYNNKYTDMNVCLKQTTYKIMIHKVILNLVANN